jgi:hypothetical protein
MTSLDELVRNTFAQTKSICIAQTWLVRRNGLHHQAHVLAKPHINITWLAQTRGATLF